MSLPPVEPLTDNTIGKLIPCNAPPMMTYTTRSPAELESMIPSSNFAALQARNAIIKPDKNTTYSNVRSAKPLRKRKKQIISTGMLSNSTHTPADMYHSELSMLLFSSKSTMLAMPSAPPRITLLGNKNSSMLTAVHSAASTTIAITLKSKYLRAVLILFCNSC